MVACLDCICLPADSAHFSRCNRLLIAVSDSRDLITSDKSRAPR